MKAAGHHFTAKPTSALPTMEAIISQGALQYVRAKHLPSLAPRVAQSASSALIIAELRNELRKIRAKAGHWSYDLNTHISLLQALRAESTKQVQ